jgi:hypothetical protein
MNMIFEDAFNNDTIDSYKRLKEYELEKETL